MDKRPKCCVRVMFHPVPEGCVVGDGSHNDPWRLRYPPKVRQPVRQLPALYAVWSPAGWLPTQLHHNYPSAEAEALRLATASDNKEFFILKGTFIKVKSVLKRPTVMDINEDAE